MPRRPIASCVEGDTSTDTPNMYMLTGRGRTGHNDSAWSNDEIETEVVRKYAPFETRSALKAKAAGVNVDHKRCSYSETTARKRGRRM